MMDRRKALFFAVLVAGLAFATLFMWQVFVKSDTCVVDPLGYWSSRFSAMNGMFVCGCSGEEGGFSFSSVDTKLKIGGGDPRLSG